MSRKTVNRAIYASFVACAILTLVLALSGCTAAQQAKAGADLTGAGGVASQVATAVPQPWGAIVGLVATVLLGVGGLLTSNAATQSHAATAQGAVTALANSAPPTVTTTTAATATTPAVTTMAPATGK